VKLPTTLKLDAFAKLNREQALALGALGVVLLACLLAVTLSLGARSDAAQELALRQEMLSRLQAQAQRPADTRAPLVAGKAPAAAFLDAPTSGLAVAQLQAYIARVAKEHQAALMSSGAELARRDDASDVIRIQATLELDLSSLQAMLHGLEAGTPYIFVETLAVQMATEGQHRAEDPTLRATLGLRALWRPEQT